MAGEKEKIVRSRTVSFRDIHIAKVTTNTETEYTAEAPSKLARAITGKISDEFETEKIYSDDSVEDVNMSYKGTSVELEVNSLAPQDKSQVFGHLYEKGFLIKTKDDKAPELALGWRAKKLNGKYEFKWLYCGRFGQGFEDNYETEGETKTTQTATLRVIFTPARWTEDMNAVLMKATFLQNIQKRRQRSKTGFQKFRKNRMQHKTGGKRNGSS